MKYTPKEVNDRVLDLYPKLIKDFYVDNNIQDYIKVIDNEMSKILDALKGNIMYLEREYGLFSKLEKLNGIKGKNIIFIPEPLEIPHVGFSIKNYQNVYVVLGSDFSIYNQNIRCLSITEYIEQVGLIIHELFHNVVEFAMENDNSSFFNEIAKKAKLDENVLEVYKNSPLAHQVDEIATEALTISYLKLIFGHENMQRYIRNSIDNGFSLSSEIADICAKHFGLL